MSFWTNLVNYFNNSDVLISLASVQWIDWVAFTVLLLGFIWGVKQGIMRMLVEVTELMIVIYLVMLSYKNLASFLTSLFGSGAHRMAEPIAFIITTAIVFLAMALVDTLLRKLMHTEVVAPLRIFGGAVLGIIQGTLLLGLLVQAVLAWPSWGIKKVFEPGGSKFGSTLRLVVPTVFDLMTEPDKALERLKNNGKKTSKKAAPGKEQGGA